MTGESGKVNQADHHNLTATRDEQDGPSWGPILPVADGLQIGQQVDAVILSVLRGVSQVPMVRAAHQRLAELNIRVLGAVVNGADMKSVYSSWYSRGYGKIYELPPGADSSEGEDGTWYSRGYAKIHE